MLQHGESKQDKLGQTPAIIKHEHAPLDHFTVFPVALCDFFLVLVSCYLLAKEPETKHHGALLLFP